MWKNTAHSTITLALISATVALSACTTTTPTNTNTATTNTPKSQNNMTSTQLVQKAMTALFVNFDVSASKSLLAKDYIQHNVAVPTGAAPVLGFIPKLKESGIKVTTHRVFAEGDLVVMHNTYENAQAFGAPTLVAFDIFRVENGKVAEHWDNLQAPPSTTASGHTMTDGETTVTDLDKTAQNKALVEAFANDVLLGGKFDKMPQYIVAAPGAYIQHNPLIPDGLDKLGGAFAQLAKAGKAISYTKVQKSIAQGNFVLLMSEGKMGTQHTAFFDLFRIKDNKIVEHWDTISAIPPADKMAHKNGKF